MDLVDRGAEAEAKAATAAQAAANIRVSQADMLVEPSVIIAAAGHAAFAEHLSSRGAKTNATRKNDRNWMI